MKKFIAIMMVLALCLCSFAMAETEGVMTHADFVAAELETEVVVETYVQAVQEYAADYSNTCIYAQSEDGAYFIYRIPCTAEDYAKLVPGQKIRVTGWKAEWSGEVEITDATFEVLEGNYIAPALDVTALLGTEELIAHQNEFVCFKGLTVEAIEYKNGQPGDDIYLTFGYNGASYSFCIESALTAADTEVYATVGTLKAGDIVDVEGFLYWYEGVNTHITSIALAA